MQLNQIQIHNFRSILDETIRMTDYSLLVGPNNSGKSTIIDALRCFYEKGGIRFSASDVPLSESRDGESWIELAFTLTHDEADLLPSQYRLQDNCLKVRKIFQTATPKPRKPGYIYAYLDNDELSDSPFFGAKNVGSGKFGDLIFIPAISKVDDQAKLGGPSPLRDLLDDIMSSVTQDGMAYHNLEASISEFSTNIRTEETADGRSLFGMSSELNQLLAAWNAEFALSFRTPPVKELLKSMLDWHFVDGDHGERQEASQYGSGFQRFFIYSLIRLAADYAPPKAARQAGEFSPTMTLVLFEEPEAFLHPHSQVNLSRSLKELSRSGQWQVICATHSPLFASRNTDDISSLTRLARQNGTASARQINSIEWSDLVADNQAVYDHLTDIDIQPEDRTVEMEAMKFFLWLNPDRASAFFASQILLVEGPTEVALINRLVDDDRLPSGIAGLYVFDCMGKYNIHRFMNLFGRLGIPHSVLHDNDGSGKGNTHQILNASIQSSRNEFTKRISVIEENLEHLLGLNEKTRSDRKPQQALYAYEIGSISESAISEFCEIVSACIG